MSPREIPELPAEVLALAEDILEELLSVPFVRKLHGKRNCYTTGCHGPLCKRAEREFNRESYAAKRAAAGKPYVPDHEVRRDGRDRELDLALSVYLRYSKAIEIHVRLNELYEELTG